MHFLDKLENYDVNFYDMEQTLSHHLTVFQDYDYTHKNLLKQKEKLFARGKWTEWELPEEHRRPASVKKLEKNKEAALALMLPGVAG